MWEALRLRFLARQFARPSGWAGRWLIAPVLNRSGAAMNKLVLEQLAPATGDRVLEAGFGGADLLASFLEAEVERVIGIDRSDAMVSRARRRFPRALRERRLRLHTASAESLPIEDAAIDKACSVNTLYFWDNPAAVLAEFARVIRPGGSLHLCFQTPEAVRRWPGHIHGFKAYSVEAIAAEVEQAGFGNVRRTAGSDPAVGEFVCLGSERI